MNIQLSNSREDLPHNINYCVRSKWLINCMFEQVGTYHINQLLTPSICALLEKQRNIIILFVLVLYS
jgi:hypothetical protein